MSELSVKCYKNGILEFPQFVTCEKQSKPMFANYYQNQALTNATRMLARICSITECNGPAQWASCPCMNAPYEASSVYVYLRYPNLKIVWNLTSPLAWRGPMVQLSLSVSECISVLDTFMLKSCRKWRITPVQVQVTISLKTSQSLCIKTSGN